MRLKPIINNPVKAMAIGVLMIVGGIFLEAFLPHAKNKAIDSDYLEVSGIGILYICGIILFLLPTLKRAWFLWRNRKK